MKPMLVMLVGASLFFLNIALFLVATDRIHEANAQQRVIADPAYTVNSGTNLLEPIACGAGNSPCAVGASATILNARPTRHECLLQNVGTIDVYCRKGAGVVTTASYHFVLKAASAANRGDGGVYGCNAGPVVWTGPVVCLGGAGGSLAVSGD
jgi:hypothetical protein